MSRKGLSLPVNEHSLFCNFSVRIARNGRVTGAESYLNMRSKLRLNTAGKRPRSIEYRKNLSLSRQNRTHSPDTKVKISNTKLLRVYRREYLERIGFYDNSQSIEELLAQAARNCISNLSSLTLIEGDTLQRDSRLYTEWVRQVKLRDQNTCRVCFSIGSKMIAHHLIEFNPEGALSNIDLSNGMTLCMSCHKKHHLSGTIFLTKVEGCV